MAFACVSECRKPLHRPHLSCPSCRLRRFLKGELPQSHYFRASERMIQQGKVMHRILYPDEAGDVVVPRDGLAYTLYIDNRRRLRWVKGTLLKYLLNVCEWLAV